MWEPESPQAILSGQDYAQRRGSRRVVDLCPGQGNTFIYEAHGTPQEVFEGEPLIAGERYELCLDIGVVYTGPFAPAALTELLWPEGWHLLPQGNPS